MSKKKKKTTKILLIVLSVMFLFAGVSLFVSREELKQDGALLGDKFESEDGVVQGTKLNGKWETCCLDNNNNLDFWDENCNYSSVFDHEYYRYGLEPVSFAIDVDFEGFKKESGIDLREVPAAKVILQYFDKLGNGATLEKQLDKDLYFYEKDLPFREYSPFSILIEIDKEYLPQIVHVSWLVDFYVSIVILD